MPLYILPRIVMQERPTEHVEIFFGPPVTPSGVDELKTPEFGVRSIKQFGSEVPGNFRAGHSGQRGFPHDAGGHLPQVGDNFRLHVARRTGDVLEPVLGNPPFFIFKGCKSRFTRYII